MASRPRLAAAACLFAVPVTFAAVTSNAATGSPTASPTSTSISAATASSASSTASTAGASAATPASTSVVEQPLTLRLDAKGTFDHAALPDPSDVFTTRELASVISAVRSTSGSDDTITLQIAGQDANDPSSLIVTMKRFGKTSDVQKAWESEKKLHQQRASADPGLYTFYGAGKNGVADSFTDGTTAHVLLQNGDAAGEIWFSGIGFGSLSFSHAASRAQYTSSVTPKLIALLGAKVKRAGATTSGASGAGASSSSPSSPSASSRADGSASRASTHSSPSSS